LQLMISLENKCTCTTVSSRMVVVFYGFSSGTFMNVCSVGYDSWVISSVEGRYEL
jgi:hypothetical protein